VTLIAFNGCDPSGSGSPWNNTVLILVIAAVNWIDTNTNLPILIYPPVTPVALALMIVRAVSCLAKLSFCTPNTLLTKDLMRSIFYTSKGDTMEKIRINNIVLDLVPMGIKSSGNTRSFTVYASSAAEADTAFSDLTSVVHVLESGEETEYRDCVDVISITDHKDSTYTVEVSVNTTERKLMDLRKEIQATEDALNILLIDLLPTIM
jgi:bifunctional DNase/RNase